MTASFLKWPKKHSSSVLGNNQDGNLLDGHPVEGAAPHTPPTAKANNGGRSKRSNSLMNIFQRDTSVEQHATDAPTPNRHSHHDPVSSNQDDNDLKTPSLLQPEAQPHLEKKTSNKFLEGTNKWLESTKRRFSAATITTTTVLSRRGSTEISPQTGRHIGEAVHTAGGAGVVNEIKADGSTVVRLVSTECVNSSLVIVEAGGEIEPLPALPQDTVVTAEGIGTAVAYNPTTKEYTVELMDNTTRTFGIDLVHSMDKDGDEASTTSTLSPQPDTASGTSLRSSFLQKMAKATPKFPALLKNRSTGGNALKYHVGQAVLTQFGDGVVVDVGFVRWKLLSDV
ncbi:hypothetical protein, variant [Aphanomyces invadans]|uniref:Uncharacterized protein n=1 Tax=Aphanomyces invadans TaxID=157072 RepID=A0A024TIL7_9STRA|nr:hypothetical protein, variant [Aphanomyces invadans]ETV93839.1 hypothetical protein, variant [Aphanomyces invadans]|eukprot:XP_008877398.1 hypothetical protein, variant [Aphanomyces invadans]